MMYSRILHGTDVREIYTLWGLMALSNVLTPAVLMLISLTIGCCVGQGVGEQIHHLW